jgi:hypothetical protein
MGTNMAGQDDLAQLEAERDRLLSMIAYHNRPFCRVPPMRAPAWFVVVVVAILCGIGVSIVVGFFAGQIDPSVFIFLVVVLPLSAYFLTRKVAIFGITFRVGDTLTGWPTGRPAGEPEAHQRLADCEARIMNLKEGRS